MNFESYEPFDNTRGRNDRFAYAKIVEGGKTLFYKKAKTSELRDNLLREKAWSDFMIMIAERFPEEKLRGPLIDKFDGEDGILMEYIDAPHLADHHDLLSWKNNLHRYARMLFVMDQAAEGWETDNSVPRIDYTQHRTNDVFNVWERWLGGNKQKVRRLDEAKALVNDYRFAMTTRMQHGDLTPWQIFDDNGTWIVYDGEKCGTDLLRYNDLAYGYGRLFTLLRSKETAAELLNEFIALSGVNEKEFADQLLPVMTGRAIGMLSDALHDQENDDYVVEAECLLDLCLTRDLRSLR